jgi:transcriptional regulator with XRE-family HTH domain
MSEFSDWLSERLKENKDSYHAIARATGVSPTTVRSWASGFTKQPGWENARKIAMALGVDEGFVLELAGYQGAGGDGEQEPADLIELRAIYWELQEGPEGRAALLAVARALRNSQRAQG